eukprot:TCALIF_08129-PA protein Name:"Protein of unknown function" AED:0.95 eAED:1.00 QI:0/0/0/0.5/1/1/2/0/97
MNETKQKQSKTDWTANNQSITIVKPPVSTQSICSYFPSPLKSLIFFIPRQTDGTFSLHRKSSTPATASSLPKTALLAYEMEEYQQLLDLFLPNIVIP